MTVDYMVVGRMMGAVALGFYVLAFNISTWPMNALGAAVRAVALPGFARVGDPDRRAATFNSAAALSWTLALLAGILLSSLATTLVPFLYGEKWTRAAQALVGLAIFGALRIVTDMMSTFLIAVGASRQVLIGQVIWIIALVPAMIAGVTIGGLSGAGWAHVAVGGAVILPLFAFIVRAHRVRMATLVRHLAIPLVGAGPAAAAGVLVADRVPGLFLGLAAGGAAATMVYLAPLVKWLPRRLRELKASGAQAAAAPAPIAVGAGMTGS
jgi:PST family polysaccharide transporter